MPSISMADFRPHLPSDSPEAALSSQTLAAGGPAAVVAGPTATGRSDPAPPVPGAATPEPVAAPSPAPHGPPASTTGPRQLLRDLFVLAVLLHLLDGGPATPLGRRRRITRLAARRGESQRTA